MSSLATDVIRTRDLEAVVSAPLLHAAKIAERLGTAIDLVQSGTKLPDVLTQMRTLWE